MRALLTLLPLLALSACDGKEEGHGHDDDHSHDSEGLDTGLEGLQLDGNVHDGEHTYEDSCAGCHGADGSGGDGPSLIDAVPVHTNVQIANIITYGSGEMPEIHIDDQEIADVIAYLRSAFGEYEEDDDH